MDDKDEEEETKGYKRKRWRLGRGTKKGGRGKEKREVTGS